jgi:formylglycine-generating enzyme required for sulfatase activity
MDATEVTRAQYQLFLEADPKPAWSLVCDFTESSTPETVSGCSAHWPPAADTQNHPVVCVSYCQAERYCQWAGKRLCTGNFNARTSFTTSEAYAACSREGQFTFPYGDSLDITACNSYYGTGIPAEVATYPGCEGGYAGLFDLAGNVEEWVDSCVGSIGATDQCGVFGKDYGDHDPQCNDTYARTRALQAPNTGFRCCADELSE